MDILHKNIILIQYNLNVRSHVFLHIVCVRMTNQSLNSKSMYFQAFTKYWCTEIVCDFFQSTDYRNKNCYQIEMLIQKFKIKQLINEITCHYEEAKSKLKNSREHPNFYFFNTQDRIWVKWCLIWLLTLIISSDINTNDWGYYNVILSSVMFKLIARFVTFTTYP